MNRTKIQKLYNNIVEDLAKQGLTISCMESCTGGQVASLITNVTGSSQVIGASFVTYSDEAKINMGVNKSIIDTYGVYSPQTAKAMAIAATQKAKSDIGVGITGRLETISPCLLLRTRMKRNTSAHLDTLWTYYCVALNKDGLNFVLEGNISCPFSKTREEMKLVVAEHVAYLIKDILADWYKFNERK